MITTNTMLGYRIWFFSLFDFQVFFFAFPFHLPKFQISVSTEKNIFCVLWGFREFFGIFCRRKGVTNDHRAWVITFPHDFDRLRIRLTLGTRIRSNIIEFEKDENGTPNGKQVLTVHVWDNEENIVPPAEISSRLNLRESEDFLVKYKIAGILTETTIEGEDLTIFYIIIGVLALLLVVAICVSVIIVCMIKRKFDRKQRAAEVLNEVNAGKIFQMPYCS